VSRRRARLAVGVVVLSAFAVSASTACEVFTRETCNAAGVNALSDPAGPACKECMERAATCDTVGHCNDVGGCQEEVKSAHACVLDAGRLAAREEDRCVRGLGAAAASTYERMRSSCGRECGLPVCKVDQATVAFGAPACDKCVTGACCDEINRCYANRTCKLILECIVRCPDPFAPTFMEQKAPGERGGPCSADDGGLPPREPSSPDAGTVPGRCVEDCIYAFRDHEQRRGDDPTSSPQCLAFTIRGCALGVGCAKECDGGFGAP
jgi:hypothetical protein